MSYVEKSLIPGEQVVYRATRQRWGYVNIGMLAVFSVIFLTHKWRIPSWRMLGAAGLVITALLAFGYWLQLSSSEFAVTNKRVIVKLGILQRRTVELMLNRIEGVQVEQSLKERIGNFGTVIVNGTGGTRETFNNIADPLEFRRQIQAQLAQIP
jgi:uncharacterized membrane protein YdbT with pleckstrin-like domain